jgi:hypothetical protein
MTYADEMDSVAKIHIPSFIKIGSGNQKLIEGGTDRHIGWRLHKPTLGE